ncbi:hypothetical protein BJF93_05700 [Xaviernesmea oryzae]|uniref:Uncharacterized protein n=1 Tax=Xaviernesmea oryzae TaxID=464029 RepID=A0A1Q9ARY7_9HYPH|nr:hypothetical protein BJF93_05700 [Xaviernesmea oryzae]
MRGGLQFAVQQGISKAINHFDQTFKQLLVAALECYVTRHDLGTTFGKEIGQWARVAAIENS